MVTVLDTVLRMIKELLVCASVAIIFVAAAAGWTMRG